MGVFLYFGAVMAFFAGTTLLWRGTVLDRLWILNLRAYNQLSSLGTTPGIAFLLLGAILAFAGMGWRRRRFWGWALTLVIVATQVLANLANAARGDFLRGCAGFLLSGALLYFLLRPKVRAAFTKRPSESAS
ncbi:MAG TPA: hypothetical protein VGR55_07060 [Candidatus Acidoferrum sp.]|nr:hypothetical protein [Candidatus Acidoferrum sp.]